MVCNSPLSVLALGFPRWCRPRSVPIRVFPGAALPELLSNLRWLLLVLGLEIPRQSQTVNLGWLLLMPGQEPLSKRYRGLRAH